MPTADYGTMGKALSGGQSNPLLGGLPSPEEAADATDSDPGTVDKKFADSPAVRDVLSQHKAGTDAALDRIHKAQDQIDALQPPVMEPAPKKPEVQNTPPSERWGSVAMLLAGFGGLLTQAPLAASLDAMAKVNHAYNEGDAEAAKNAYATWKVENDNAIKMNEFHNKAYEDALKKVSSNYTGAVAEARIMAVSLKDDVALSLFNSGRPDDAMRILGARPAATAKLTEASANLTYRQGDMQKRIADYTAANGHPPDPQALNAMWNETKVEGKPTSASGSAESDTQTLAAQEFKEQHDGKEPGPGDEAAMAQIRRDLRRDDKNQDKPAGTFADLKKDVRDQHPEWSEGQIDTEATRQITEAKQPTMDDDAADLNARIALKTGHAPTSMGRSQANIAKFQNTYAKVARESGLTADEIAANQVKFTGEMSEARTLGTTSARIDFGAKELDVALPQALDLSEKVYRPGFKKIADIMQAVQGQTNDPDLLEFAQQNQAVMNAYAQVMSRGGVSTVSSMERSERLLSTATSQAAYMRQLDRLHKEVQTMLYGTAAAKQNLQNEITGGSKEITPPKLTNVPRSGESNQSAGPKDGDKATSKSGKPMIFSGGTWQYQQ